MPHLLTYLLTKLGSYWTVLELPCQLEVLAASVHNSAQSLCDTRASHAVRIMYRVVGFL